MLYFKLLFGYLFLISLLTFILLGIDKRKARLHQWRIPESHFLLLVLLGGAPGALIAMYLFHHKTRHLKFTIGIPLILTLQIIIFILLSPF